MPLASPGISLASAALVLERGADARMGIEMQLAAVEWLRERQTTGAPRLPSAGRQEQMGQQEMGRGSCSFAHLGVTARLFLQPFFQESRPQGQQGREPVRRLRSKGLG